jgi:hypothetical protein
MRRGEGLVQIDMHCIDAEIAWAYFAGNRVEIRAVAIEIGSCVVQGFGDFGDLWLEQPARIRVGQHHRGDIRPKRLADNGGVYGSVFPGLNGANRKAEQRGRCRVRAMRRIRHQHHAPCIRLALCLDGGADRDHAAQLTMRARLGR